MTLQELITYLSNAQVLGAETVWVESDSETFNLNDVEYQMVFGNVILKVVEE